MTICVQCKNDLAKAYSFKQLCLKSQNTLQNIADCRLDLDEQQFNLLDYLKTDNCAQSVELILGNEVDAIAEGLLKDAEEVGEEDLNEIQEELPDLPKCKICLESFDLDCDLETHMISHPENNKAVCTLCQKQFKNLKVLKRHVKTHLKKKPYEVKDLLSHFFMSCIFVFHQLLKSSCTINVGANFF